MATQRKNYGAEFKARVALEAIKGHKTINELVSHFGVHPTQINKWKRHLQTELPQIFSNRREKREQDHEALQAQLYQQNGQLKVELDWLKKNLDLGIDCQTGPDRAASPSNQHRSAMRVVGVTALDLLLPLTRGEPTKSAFDAGYSTRNTRIHLIMVSVA